MYLYIYFASTLCIIKVYVAKNNISINKYVSAVIKSDQDFLLAESVCM